MKCLIYIFCSVFVLAFINCTKTERPVEQTKQVFIVGSEKSPTNDRYIARLWKDGNAVALTSGVSNAEAHAVAVVGEDVYACGSEAISGAGPTVAKLWKNGIAIPLTEGVHSSFASAMSVWNEQVYVAVTMQDVADQASSGVWSNGTLSLLEANGQPAAVYGLAVSDARLYASGGVSNPDSAHALLWTNGAPLYLSSAKTNTVADAVTVSGNDVYACGTTTIGDTAAVAVLWKNGVATLLHSGQMNNGFATALSVQGNDVYVVFNEMDPVTAMLVPKLWKNGSITPLTTNAGVRNGTATGLFVSGTDVYIVFNEDGTDTIIPKLWHNGTVTALTDGSTDAYAYSVFVK